MGVLAQHEPQPGALLDVRCQIEDTPCHMLPCCLDVEVVFYDPSNP